MVEPSSRKSTGNHGAECWVCSASLSTSWLPEIYEGAKKGNPITWSQWGCDRKILKQCLRPGPCSRSTWLPNSRTPVPRSQITYSSPPVVISTQLVLPPNVPRTENGSLLSMNASIACSVSSACPRAASSASRILPRTARSRSGAGSEPRVPQKRIRNGPAGSASARGTAAWVRGAACQAVLASSTVANTGTTCENRLIAKISLTTARRWATARCRSFGFWRDAVINARNPALDIYSTPEKSTTTSAELEPTAASSRA